MAEDSSSLADDLESAIPFDEVIPDYESFDDILDFIEEGKQEANRKKFLGQLSRCNDVDECFHFCDQGM